MAGKDSLIERLTDHYLSRRDYAFSLVPKSMARMEAQEFSQVFRRQYPTFNGLIWAYHWLLSRLHPRAAVIFDNLPIMHDIISDILASERIPRRDKRPMIYRQLDEFRDSTSHVITMDEWRKMGAEGHEGHGAPPPAADSMPADQRPHDMDRH